MVLSKTSYVPRDDLKPWPKSVRYMLGIKEDLSLKQLRKWDKESKAQFPSNDAGNISASAGGSVLFNITDPVSIFQAASLSTHSPAPFITTALGYNGGSNEGVDVYLSTSPKQIWSIDGQGYLCAAGGKLSVTALCAVDATSAVCNVTAFETSSGKIVWTKQLNNGAVVSLSISPDGTVVSALYISALPPYPASNFTSQVMEWDSATGKSRPTWTGPYGMGGRALVSSNSLFAIVDTETVVLIDRATGSSIFQAVFDWSSSTLCISLDGSSFGYGFQEVDVYIRQGATYSKSYTVDGSSQLAGTCSFVGDLSSPSIAIGWYNYGYNQNTVSVQSSTGPVWTFKYPPDTGSTCQNLPVAQAVTSDGKYFAVASWGGSGGTSPQLAVFATSKADGPTFTLNTPGSMNAVDITEVDGEVYVVAAGKAVHNNVFGEGGNLFSVKIIH